MLGCPLCLPYCASQRRDRWTAVLPTLSRRFPCVGLPAHGFACRPCALPAGLSCRNICIIDMCRACAKLHVNADAPLRSDDPTLCRRWPDTAMLVGDQQFRRLTIFSSRAHCAHVYCKEIQRNFPTERHGVSCNAIAGILDESAASNLEFLLMSYRSS